MEVVVDQPRWDWLGKEMGWITVRERREEGEKRKRRGTRRKNKTKQGQDKY